MSLLRLAVLPARMPPLIWMAGASGVLLVKLLLALSRVSVLPPILLKTPPTVSLPE